MFNKEDYTKILDRARKKRNNNAYIRYLLIGAVVALVIGLLILVSGLVKDRTSGGDGPGQEVARTVEEPATVEITVDEEASPGTKLLMRSLCLGLEGIRQSYGDTFIQIMTKEV